MTGKKDMSNECGFHYDEYWIKANQNHTMSHEEWTQWYNAYCGQCKYMCEICMYGEE